MGKGEQVLAGVQLNLLLAHEGFVEIEADGGLLGLVGLREYFHVEGLPLLDSGGHGEFSDRDVIAAAGAQRQNIERHAQREGGGDGGHGVAHVFVSVGEQDEAFLARFGHGGRAQANGAGDVGAVNADDGLDLAQIDLDVGTGLNGGFGAENQNAGGVGVFFGGGGLVDVGAGGILLG